VAVRVGGVSIGLGLDNTNLLRGFDIAKSKVKDFEKAMTSIRLAAVIKGDPIAETRNYMKTARKGLNDVFDEWKQNIGYVASSFNKFAEESRRTTQSVIKDWESISKKMMALQTVGKGRIKASFKEGVLGEATPLERTAKLGQFITGLEGKYGDISPKVSQYISKLKENLTGKFLKEGMDVNTKAVYGSLQHLEKLLKTEGGKIVAEYEQFGKKLRAASQKQAKLEFESKKVEAKSPEAAYARRRKALDGLTLAEHKYRTEISLGIDVEKNKIALYGVLNRRQELGKKLIGQQVEEHKKYKKAVDGARDASEKFLSPQWIKSRLRWFVQLRLAWTVWRGLTEAMRGVVEFEQAIVNVQAISRATTEQFEELKQKALEVGSTTRFSATEAAEAMTIFAQAGMTTKEIINAITDSSYLATATLYDFKKTAEIIVSVLRAWNLNATETKRVTDILAGSISESKLTMDSLATSLNYLAGIAPQLNLELQETTALMGTLANRGLRASVAATSLRAVMAELLKPTDRFRMVIGNIGLNLRDVSPKYKTFEEILLTLQKAGWGVAESFQAFGRRGAAGATIIVQNAASLRDLADRMNQNNRAMEMAARNLDTVSGQWKQFKDILIASGTAFYDKVNPALRGAISLFQELGRAAGWAGEKIGQVVEGWFMIKRLIAGEQEKPEIPFANLQMKLGDYRKNLSNIINDYRNLRNSYLEYKNEILKGTKADAYEKAIKMAKSLGLISDEEIKKLKDKKAIEEKIDENYKIKADKMAIESRNLMKWAENQNKTNIDFANEELKVKLENLKKLEKENERINQRLIESFKKETFFKGYSPEQQEKFIRKVKESPFFRGKGVGGTITAKINKAKADLENFYSMLEMEQRKEILALSPELQELFGKKIGISFFPDTESLKRARQSLEKAAGLPPAQEDPEKKRLEQIKDELILRNQAAQEESTGLKRKLQILQASEQTEEVMRQILALSFDIWQVDREIANNEKRITEITNIAKENDKELLAIAELKNKNMLLAAEDADTLREKAAIEDRKQFLLKLNNLELEKQTNKLTLERTRLEIGGESPEEILRVELKMLEERGQKLQRDLIILNLYNAKSDEIKQKTNEINALESERLQILERMRRAIDPMYDAYKRMEASVAKINQFKSDLYFKTGTDIAEGLADIFTKASGGFQDAQQEVANLKGTLAGLIQERDKILEDGIITSDEIDRFKELQTEISQTSDQISDLEDPIQNLKDSFKDFFKSVIDGIREMIAKWIAMKIITGIMGGFTNAGAGASIGTSGDYFGSGDSAIWGAWPGQKGGVFPKFESMRAFARGGVISRPTLALLGEGNNPKEIVLPVDNIHSSSVGPAYLKESSAEGNVTIINVVTEDALAREMSKPKIGKVIVNRVYENIDSGGILSRR